MCALLTVQDEIVKLLDECDVGAVRIVTFDNSRAFDCVSHGLLTNCINSALTCTGNVTFVSWLQSYLENRKQRVRIGDTVSSFSEVTSGVPQGSILGPCLFAIFMSSYSAYDSNTLVTKYADDVTIVIPVKKENFDDLTTVSAEIDNFKRWCEENKMTINMNKTKVLNINVTNNPLPSASNMDNVGSLKLLGLTFNEKLNWTDHFKNIVAKLSKRLYVLRILKRLLNHDPLIILYNAIFRPVLDYASQVFLKPGCNLNIQLNRICKRAFYVIHGGKP